MDLATFFEHFDTLAEAPNGIQRLRELILDMAVRGKLVPQDPEDEPAKELLRKITDEKKLLIKNKVLRNQILWANLWIMNRLYCQRHGLGQD
jgi:type I restriction enzyme S subunit